MRIATAQLFEQGLREIADLQAKAARAQSEVATGKRILTAADDPAAAAQVLNGRDLLAQTQRFDSNINTARSRLDLEESVLTNVGNVLQRVRELAVRANNATLDNNDRAAIAAELEERLEELLSLANTRASGGEYIFSGFQSHTRPFTRSAAGSFDYNGDQGQRFVRVSPSTQIAVNDSGSEVFRDIRNGNGTFAVGAAASNTGSAVIDNGSVTNPTLWIADNYSINFISATNYEVRDSGGAVIASGSYGEGDTISFSGIEVTVTGAPAAGDTLFVAPSANQNLFQTVDNLIQTLGISAADGPSQAAITQGVN
ncbi:MAG: flagellar hook-associated protein FlgL, partial [Gammaproteobacteria bacterium]|nr:flagellar hook-associated protein FlgL [Gammaproteobacteria bacterium]